ncbi:MAG: ABC transporter permease subunit [Chloroflexota bacterium]
MPWSSASPRSRRGPPSCSRRAWTTTPARTATRGSCRRSRMSSSSWPSRCRSGPSGCSPSRSSCMRVRIASARACARCTSCRGPWPAPSSRCWRSSCWTPGSARSRRSSVPWASTRSGASRAAIGCRGSSRSCSSSRRPAAGSPSSMAPSTASRGSITEAAIVDGCDPLRIAWSIKLPLVRPYVIYMLVLTFAANVQIFVEPQLLAVAPGATVGKYWSLNQLSYAYAFELSDFGSAAAISLLMLGVGLVAAILIIRFTNFFRPDVIEH